MEIKCYQQGRCPMCTLMPPCNHVKESELPKTTSIFNKKGSPFKFGNSRSVSPVTDGDNFKDSVDSLFEPSAWTETDDKPNISIQIHT